MAINILIADDNSLLTEGISKLLEDFEDIRVVAVAADRSEILTKVSETYPDVVVMDNKISTISGMAIIKQIKVIKASIHVLILTREVNFDQIHRALEAGATGYMLKHTSCQELVRAIRVVHEGNSYFHPLVAKVILDSIVASGTGSFTRTEPDHTLSEREMQVLCLIAEGLTNQEIANRLFISIKTVQTHRRNTMDKLDLHDRVDLVKYALRKGLIALEEESTLC